MVFLDASTSTRSLTDARSCMPTCTRKITAMCGSWWPSGTTSGSHQEAALAYEGLKRELASKYRDDRVSYTDAKGAFINELTAAALADSLDGTEVKR